MSPLPYIGNEIFVKYTKVSGLELAKHVSKANDRQVPLWMVNEARHIMDVRRWREQQVVLR